MNLRSEKCVPDYDNKKMGPRVEQHREEKKKFMWILLLFFLDFGLADPPLVLFGGMNPGANVTGFLFPDVRNAPEVDFFSQVNTVICSHQEKVVVGTAESVSDAAPEIDRVAVQRLDGEVRTVLEIETRLDANTIATGMILVGGIFSGGLVLWDRFGLQTVGPGALVPPCVLSLAYVDPLMTPPRDAVYLGGCFQRMGTMILNGVARIQFKKGFLPTNEHPEWEALGDGFQGKEGNAASVFAIASMNDFVYAGGDFSFSGKTPLRNVARFNTNLKKWQDLGGGVDGIIRALAPSPHDAYNGVYMGGSFCSVKSPMICNVAFWNAESGWKNLGNGVRGEVLTLLLVGPTLYVGGQYVCPDTIKANLGAWLETEGKWYNGELAGGSRPGIVRTIAQCPCAKGSVLASNGDCVTDDTFVSTAPPSKAEKSPWRKGGKGRFLSPHKLQYPQKPSIGYNFPTKSTWLGATTFVFLAAALAGPVAFIYWRRRQREIQDVIITWNEQRGQVHGVEGMPLMTYKTYGVNENPTQIKDPI